MKKANTLKRTLLICLIPICFTAFFSAQAFGEHSAPSVRTLKIFDIAQVTTTKTL